MTIIYAILIFCGRKKKKKAEVRRKKNLYRGFLYDIMSFVRVLSDQFVIMRKLKILKGGAVDVKKM